MSTTKVAICVVLFAGVALLAACGPGTEQTTPAGPPGPAATQGDTSAAPAPAAAAGQDIVHATKTGKCYHRAGCSSLSRSDIPMTRQEAEAQGLTPCSNCNP